VLAGGSTREVGHVVGPVTTITAVAALASVVVGTGLFERRQPVEVPGQGSGT
jgi:hypothetical protein